MIEGQDTVRVTGADYTMVVRTPEIELGKSITEGVWKHIEAGRNLVWVDGAGPGLDKVVVLNPARVSWIEL